MMVQDVKGVSVVTICDHDYDIILYLGTVLGVHGSAQQYKEPIASAVTGIGLVSHVRNILRTMVGLVRVVTAVVVVRYAVVQY